MIDHEHACAQSRIATTEPSARYAALVFSNTVANFAKTKLHKIQPSDASKLPSTTTDALCRRAGAT